MGLSIEISSRLPRFHGTSAPRTSLALLGFELEMLSLTWEDEASGGCRSCYWAPLDGDGPSKMIHHYNDAAPSIALVRLCETCHRGMSSAEFERVFNELKPTDFVQAAAVDEWGGLLLGDPAAGLEAKVDAVIRWLSSEKEPAA